MSYGLKNNYALGVAVSPADLNRRADVLQAQLPGAMRGLGTGVFGLGQLLVGRPVAEQISPGDALIENGDGVLVYVHVPTALYIPQRGAETYLHLALRVPPAGGGPGDSAGTDSRRGAAPSLLLSENEDETDAILLAAWNGTAWIDARPLAAPALLELARADIDYDPAERAKGTLSERLNALSIPVDLGSGGPTAAQFGALQALVASQGVRLEALEAQMAALQSDGTTDDFPSFEDQLADEIAINRAGLAEVNPSAIERGQISVVMANAGHGQFDGPDYSPTTGVAGELTFDEDDGTFGA
jgi:hypothetical protein